MAVREFVDSAGVAWRVWNTRPSSRVALMLGYEDGWLTFEGAGALRRLMPVPLGWEEVTDAELERLCRVAGPVVRRVRQGEGAGEPAARTWWNDRPGTGGPRRDPR